MKHTIKKHWKQLGGAYTTLKVLGAILIFVVAAGIIGVYCIDNDHAGVLGNSYLLASPLFSVGLLASIWIDPTTAYISSYALARIIGDVIAWLLVAIYITARMILIFGTCTDAVLLAGDPVLNEICTSQYVYLIVSLVYAFVAFAVVFALFVAELVIHYRVKRVEMRSHTTSGGSSRPATSNFLMSTTGANAYLTRA